jgi:hypothetical protein
MISDGKTCLPVVQETLCGLQEAALDLSIIAQVVSSLRAYGDVNTYC